MVGCAPPLDSVGRVWRPAHGLSTVGVLLTALIIWWWVDGEIADSTVKPGSLVAGRPRRELVLPDGVLVTLILRSRQVFMPRGSTVLLPGDHVFVALRTRLEPLIDPLFDPAPEPAAWPPGLRLTFPASTSLVQLHTCLGLPLPTAIDAQCATLSLGALLAQARPQRVLMISALRFKAGADQDQVAVTMDAAMDAAPV